jgi:hypothetical protein
MSIAAALRSAEAATFAAVSSPCSNPVEPVPRAGSFSRILFSKWATSSGSWPRPRRRSAKEANWRAASAVMSSRVFPGRSSSGFSMRARRMRRGSFGSAERSARVNLWTITGVLVKFVCISKRSRSQTTRSGGLSRASRYWRS